MFVRTRGLDSALTLYMRRPIPWRHFFKANNMNGLSILSTQKLGRAGLGCIAQERALMTGLEPSLGRAKEFLCLTDHREP